MEFLLESTAIKADALTLTSSRHSVKLYGVEQSFTSPYNPRGNAFCERFNRTLFGLLKTLKSEEKADWPSHLPALVFAYNATPHASTGYQPYQT